MNRANEPAGVKADSQIASKLRGVAYPSSPNVTGTVKFVKVCGSSMPIVMPGIESEIDLLASTL